MLSPSDVTAVLTTKFGEYPREILDSLKPFPFFETIIATRCQYPARQFELASFAQTKLVYIQDDDCITFPGKLLEAAQEEHITCIMKMHYIEEYADSKCALLGWGSIIPRHVIARALFLYSQVYGRDVIYKREAPRIVSIYGYPQGRITFPVVDLPWATAPDRLSMQSDHYQMRDEVLKRCELLF